MPASQTQSKVPLSKTASPDTDPYTDWMRDSRLPGEARAQLVALNLRTKEALTHLQRKLKEVLDRSGHKPVLLERSLYLGKDIPLSGTAHQAGTARFGTDPKSSVLDLDCKAHELDNLYLADASFFPAIGAVNPTLTIIANALRVADRIAERLK